MYGNRTNDLFLENVPGHFAGKQTEPSMAAFFKWRAVRSGAGGSCRDDSAECEHSIGNIAVCRFDTVSAEKDECNLPRRGG